MSSGAAIPLAAERQEPVHVPVLFAFLWPALVPDELATGRTVAAHAAPGHDSSRTTSITLHLCLCAGLHTVRLKKEQVLRWG
jgi:hypothetical protein